MSTGRKSGSGGRTGGAPAVDPHAPTQTSLRPDELPPEGAKKLPSGAFTPDAPTKIMPPMTSFDDDAERDDPHSARRGLAGAAAATGAYDPDARTQAMNLGPNGDDPFTPRVTDAELRSFSSEEAEGAPLLDADEDGARVDLRPPGQRRSLPPADDDDDIRDVVEISLSDMDALPELADDDSEEDTHDTVVNLPLPASLRRDADDAAPMRSATPSSAAGARRAQIPPLPTATVVERRSHSPAALFDEDTASVTDPRGEKPALVERAPPGAGDDEGEPLPPFLASERTAARPSLVSQPSGDPAPPDAAPVGQSHGADPVEEEAPAYWDEDSLPEAEPDETVAPELSDLSHDELPPLLHRWKVVPTVVQGLERPPPAPQPSLDEERAKKLQTVLWSPNDEAAARAEHAAAARARNPFWAPTDVGADVDDDDPLESIEAAAPSDPRQAAAAYVHDAIAYLRSLSYLGAHLDEEIRVDFDARLLGANEKLRRALTVLQSASDHALANATASEDRVEQRQTRGVPAAGGFRSASNDDDDDDGES